MSLKLRIIKGLFVHQFRKVPTSRKALEQWQNRKIKEHVRHIIKQSPFYAKRLKKYKSWDKFPVINKAVFMENFDTINTHGIRKEEAYEVALKAEESRDFSPMIGAITVGLSSGTSGNRSIFLASVKERAQWVAYVLSKFVGFELKKRRIAFFLRANSNLYTAAGSQLIDFNFFDLQGPIKENIAKLRKYQPHILIAQPSMLVEIAHAQNNGQLNLNPEKIISVAEVLESEDHALLKKTFNQTIHQAYQCTEGFLAKTCEYGTLHFNEDIVKIEKKYIDEEKERYHPIITDFTRTTQPMIRYELNDIIIDRKEPCPCGSCFQAIDHIEGRSDDIFILKNTEGAEVKIFPDFIRRAVITASTEVQEYIVEQSAANEIRVFLKAANFETTKQLVSEKLNQLFSKYNIKDYQLIFYAEIPKLNTNKLRRIRRTVNL